MGTTGHFRHEALLYAGPEDFVHQVGGFVAEGVRRREPTLVLVDEAKIARLRDALGASADGVEFADMATLGHSGRVLAVWQDFVARRAGHGPVRGVGEHVGSGRTADEVTECQRLEALLNVAFEGDVASPWLVCPYDTDSLPESVVSEARRTHPIVRADGISSPSTAARSTAEHARASTIALTPPPAVAVRSTVEDVVDVEPMRHLVARTAADAGLSASRVDDVALVVAELAGNSLRHAGMPARIAVWRTATAFVVEVRDGGRIDDPLVGRRRPAPDAIGGRGLWITNQLADLVQQRSLDGDNVVRAHFLLVR